MSEVLERFGNRWLARLNNGARTVFEHAEMHEERGLHSAVADDFVAGLGMKPIGFNWELLDASREASGPRSAFAQLAQALSNDISNPSKEWLGATEAERCAFDFLQAFDQATLTFVSNRYDGLWNPISGASVEWGFVGFDARHIALLLIAEA